MQTAFLATLRAIGAFLEQNKGRVCREPEKAVAPKDFSLVILKEPSRIECSKPSTWRDHEMFVPISTKMDADETHKSPRGKCCATAFLKTI
jgi:hypothetical protein